MDNFNGINMFPPTLGLLLNDDLLARDHFTNLDDERKADIIRFAKDEFQSKEELERYLYHLEENDFR